MAAATRVEFAVLVETRVCNSMDNTLSLNRACAAMTTEEVEDLSSGYSYENWI